MVAIVCLLMLFWFYIQYLYTALKLIPVAFRGIAKGAHFTSPYKAVALLTSIVGLGVEGGGIMPMQICLVVKALYCRVTNHSRTLSRTCR